MVFFTCSSCGDSLKKNAVEKHINSKCSSAQYVTCIDCHKDFWGNDYIDHTSCITEDEKYGSSNQVVKESKGRKKQQQWIQNLKLYVENYKGLDSKLQYVIQKIIAFDNIPQKEKKFKNFLANSLQVSPKITDKAWEILQEAFKSGSQIKSDSEKGVNPLENDCSDEKMAEDITREKENSLEKSLKKKKSKKRKLDEENDVEMNDLSPAKKAKINCEKEVTSEMEVVLDDAIETSKISKKKRKNKNKDCKDQEGSLTKSCEVDNHNGEEIKTAEETLKKKKKKTKLTNGVNDLEQTMENETSSKKKSKKRSVCEMEGVIEGSANGDSRSSKKKLKLESIDDCNKEFKWEDSVSLALQSNAGSLKIKKLEKIVVPQLLETKLVLSEDEAKRLFKEHISNPMYVINGKIIQLK